MPHQRSIILIGPVGAGKTLVAQALSVELSLPVVDVDRLVENSIGMPISQAMITNPDQCEEAQRNIAHAQVGALAHNAAILVIPPAASTCDPVSEAIQTARSYGVLVAELTADVAEISRRLGLNGPRTVQLGAPRAMLAKMLAATHEHHRTLANVSVATVGHSIEDVAQEILAAL